MRCRDAPGRAPGHAPGHGPGRARRPRVWAAPRDRLPYRGCPVTPGHAGLPRTAPARAGTRTPTSSAALHRSARQCTTIRRRTWLPTATSAARARASGTASRTPTAARSAAGTRTSSVCAPSSPVPRSACRSARRASRPARCSATPDDTPSGRRAPTS
ncbi:hypothetical protein N868_08510 [Cellulomonas carbonis T26]|uniref:Uncharacterized protein n=1 Tax=Cellulomonas carbonis T26 TaxID=947969 RepID=A0A0A0BJ31_9CELL|nr:hypothetical protein N868_08510 [Cellulomonas carbonis T26]